MFNFEKKWFSEKTVMSHVMVVLIGIVIVAATIAWFAVQNMPRVEALELQLAEISNVRADVKIEPYTVDLEQEDILYSEFYTNAELKTSEYAMLSEDGVHYDITRMSLSLAGEKEDVAIDMGQKEMNSLEKGKLGPGAFGRVVFYLRSFSNTPEKYRIQVIPQLLYATDTLGEEREQEMEELVKDHIRFYKSCQEDVADENLRTYSGRIWCQQGQGLEGDLFSGQEQMVTLYWCWHYEYTDIPVEETGNGDLSESSSTSYDIESYDLGDTKIGNYVTDIRFFFAVIGEAYESVSG